MQLDELLIIYFLYKHQCRLMVERKLVEFLASLKYYSERMLRAKTFSLLVGFYKPEQQWT